MHIHPTSQNQSAYLRSLAERCIRGQSISSNAQQIYIAIMHQAFIWISLSKAEVHTCGPQPCGARKRWGKQYKHTTCTLNQTSNLIPKREGSMSKWNKWFAFFCTRSSKFHQTKPCSLNPHSFHPWSGFSWNLTKLNSNPKGGPQVPWSLRAQATTKMRVKICQN